MQHLKNSFKQVYWVFCKPLSFERKVNALTKETVSLLAQSLLAISILNLLVVGTIGWLYDYRATASFDWLGAAIGVVGGVVFGVACGAKAGSRTENVANGAKISRAGNVTGGVACGVAMSVGYGVAFGVAFGILNNVAGDVVFWMANGVANGMTFGILNKVAFKFNMAGGIANDVAYGVAFSMVIGVMIGVTIGMAYGMVMGVTIGMAYGMVMGVTLVLFILRVHLWLLELLWVCLLYLRQILWGILPSLNKLPFYYDELIILPLPFLQTWLIRAYGRNPVSTLQTLDYLTNTTNQQELAAQARIGIVVEALSGCQTFNDLSCMHQKFSWLPNPLPKEFDAAITELLEISQDVYAAQQASSAFRSAKLLNPPLRRLQDLQKTLSFAKSPHTPTLGDTTQRWLSIVTTASQNYQEQVRHDAEIPQAYIAGNPLSPEEAKESFKGRQDIFQAIETFSLEQSPPVLLLYGGRRTGKTSSLKYLPQKVDSSLVPLLVDLQGTALSQHMSSFAQTFARQIQTFARENHRLSLPSPPPQNLELDPFPTLLDWFNQIESIAPHKRFLLCLDEFEKLSEVINATNNKAPLNFLRTLVQHHKRWILLFSGSHTLEELEPYWSDTLINAQSLRMTYLQKNEAQDLILHPVANFPPIYTKEAIERLLYWTSCQPYLLQLFGTVIVDEFNRRSEPLQQRATAQDIDRFVPKVLERGKAYFNELWRKTLNTEQRQILTQFMLEKHLQEIRKHQISALIDKEILLKNNEHYQFQVPLTEIYCHQQVK